jgi:hypothetical protein
VSSDGRDGNESGQPKVAIECEGSLDVVSAHQRKRDAIREAYPLISVLFEIVQGHPLVVLRGSQDQNAARRIDPPGLISRERVPGPPGELGEDLIEDEIARDEAISISRELAPNPNRRGEILIIAKIPADEGSTVDENQSSSP